MKHLLLRYAHYNLWANRTLTTLIGTLPAEKQIAEVPGSFNSLHQTTLHIWEAEDMWWQRLRLEEKISRVSETFSGDYAALTQKLLQQGQQWIDWIAAQKEAQLEHVFHYHNTKRELFKQPRYEAIWHLFNHGTYHRGQLVSMLHQVGVHKIPPTDFIFWIRKK